MAASSFVWCLHQPAAAAWLKRELAAERPDLRFAFARPGLTTFKVNEADAGTPIVSSFARAWGTSLGRAETVAQVLGLAETIAPQPLRLHVFERDPDCAADERDPGLVATRPRAIEEQLRAAAPGRFLPGNEAKLGDLVLDVITPASEAPSEPWLVGHHRHASDRGRWPGGVAHVPIPAASPSRAWAKIEEAIAWSGLLPTPGESAVEIGSAPGGASFALLERGLNVHGIDPGEMAPHVLRYVGPAGNRFVHHASPAGALQRRDLPKFTDWLLTDVNLAPMVALKYLERLVAWMGPPKRGAFLTLKLNDDGVFAALPRLKSRVERMFPAQVRFVQLPAHRSEIVAIMQSRDA